VPHINNVDGALRLCPTASSTTLWTVSDCNGKVYLGSQYLQKNTKI